MKELPAQERPYEKCRNLGPESLTDAELLAVILRSGTKEATCLELANEVLAVSDTESGLLGLHTLTPVQLQQISGIGPVKSIQLLCIGELCKRMASMPHSEGIRLTKPDQIAEYYMERMRHLEQEHVKLLLLDSKCRLLHELTLSIGSVNQSILGPREVFIAALQYKAVNLVLLHNHPSGDPTPSKQDMLTTRRIKEMGDVLGVPLVDHIIIGDQNYISLREEGFL